MAEEDPDLVQCTELKSLALLVCWLELEVNCADTSSNDAQMVERV